MKLKSRPSKPKRKRERVSSDAAECSLVEIFDQMHSLLVDSNYSSEEISEHLTMNNIIIENEWDYDDYRPVAVLELPESDASFESRQTVYRRALEMYNTWYEENKDAIQAEKEKRLQESNASEAEKIKAQMRKLEQKLQKVES